MLNVCDGLPPGFLDVSPGALIEQLKSPTLFHLPGQTAEPLFVSVMLHGNEPAGLYAIQKLLRRYKDQTLPRALSVFVGNVYAAHHGKRYLPGQPDYNRIWCTGRGEEHEMTQRVLYEMRQRRVFAGIDVHNNTGRNPHYGIIAKDRRAHIQLARGFAQTVVYATYPDTTCTVAFSELCPAVTIEAGMPDDKSGVEQAYEFIDACLRHDRDMSGTMSNADLYHTVAVVKVSQECSFGFQDDDVDLEFVEDLDRFNFTELAPGVMFGRARTNSSACLRVINNHGVEVKSTYFETDEQGSIRTTRPLMPAMLTTDRDIIGMDCLCYLMERMRFHENG